MIPSRNRFQPEGLGLGLIFFTHSIPFHYFLLLPSTCFSFLSLMCRHLAFFSFLFSHVTILSSFSLLLLFHYRIRILPSIRLFTIQYYLVGMLTLSIPVHAPRRPCRSCIPRMITSSLYFHTSCHLSLVSLTVDYARRRSFYTTHISERFANCFWESSATFS